VGIIIHELLTGQRLFIDQTEAATLSQVLTKPIPHPRSLNDQVPEDLDRVVMTLLERDREVRYERARDALDALLACSLATSKGRSDLETVMGERFPEQAPKRVTRLSRSAEEAAQSARLKRGSVPPVGRPSTSATAVTQVASPAGKPGRAAQPKRTETAMPARQSAGMDPATGSSNTQPPVAAMAASTNLVTPPPTKSVWPLRLVLLALVGVVVAATVLVTTGKGTKEGTEATDVELLVIESDEPTRDAGAKAAAVGSADASPNRPDASAATAKPERLDEDGKKARLTIQVKPWATIEIDGKAYGQTPQEISLRQGRHQIVLANPGLKRSEKVKVKLKAGKSSTIDLDWTKKNTKEQD